MRGNQQGINDAHSVGHSLAIVTHSPGNVPTEYARKENWPIEIIVGWHDYQVRKPNPKGILLAMRKGNAVPENTYHIGDQPSDTEARKAGWNPFHRGGMGRDRPGGTTGLET